jgi:cytochrome c oxidase subunit II
MNRAIILMLALSGALGMVTLAAASKTGSTTEKVIQVTSKKFEFSPSEIKVKKGQPLVLELTSVDREHGFYLPDFGVDGRLKPGEITRVSFTPDKTGKFPFACDVFCGSGHEEMSGTLVVTE